MSSPWRNWYHAVFGTYGSWLYGDPRGFRTWRHRVHVEGDYRQPPPEEAYAVLYERTKKAMTRDAVRLGPEERRVVAEAIAEKLRQWDMRFVSLAVASSHVHLLVRFRPLEGEQSRGMAIPRLSEHSALSNGRDPLPRHVIGVLKKHASHVHRTSGLPPRPGGLWAKRGKIIPVGSRGHQVAVAQYIARHVEEGAEVVRGA